MKPRKKYKEGTKVKYVGAGFLSFIKTEPEAIFLSLDGPFDAYINYKGTKVLVRRYEIE